MVTQTHAFPPPGGGPPTRLDADTLLAEGAPRRRWRVTCLASTSCSSISARRSATNWSTGREPSKPVGRGRRHSCCACLWSSGMPKRSPAPRPMARGRAKDARARVWVDLTGARGSHRGRLARRAAAPRYMCGHDRLCRGRLRLPQRVGQRWPGFGPLVTWGEAAKHKPRGPQVARVVAIAAIRRAQMCRMLS
jgi:hypothetical protein